MRKKIFLTLSLICLAIFFGTLIFDFSGLSFGISDQTQGAITSDLANIWPFALLGAIIFAIIATVQLKKSPNEESNSVLSSFIFILIAIAILIVGVLIIGLSGLR